MCCQLVLILDEDELHVIRTSSQSWCNKLCGQSEPVYSKKPWNVKQWNNNALQEKRCWCFWETFDFTNFIKIDDSNLFWNKSESDVTLCTITAVLALQTCCGQMNHKSCTLGCSCTIKAIGVNTNQLKLSPDQLHTKKTAAAFKSRLSIKSRHQLN